LRKFVVAAVAIVAFGAFAMLVIALAPVGPGTLDGTSGSSPSQGPPPPLPPLPAASAPSAPPAGLAVTPQVIYAPADPPPPPGSWEAVKPVARLGALGPVGAAVGRELNELQPELSACFDEVAQAQHGQQPFSATGVAEPAGTGPAVLVLLLEMEAGAVRIVDAPVDRRGGASDGLIACAQGVLRGHVVKAPGARPGQRARVMFTLVP